MFKITEENGTEKSYDLMYSIRKVDAIEHQLKKSVLGCFVKVSIDGTQEVMTPKISETRTLFINGLVDEEGKNVPSPLRDKMFESLINEYGYAELNNIIYDALERDCGFLFR